MADTTPSKNQDLLEEILTELLHIKKQLPNGELKTLMIEMREVKEDVSDMKRRILDPENGLIVKVNKNTQFREDSEEPFAALEQDVKNLLAWKENNVKAVWILFTAVTGLVVSTLFRVL